jgi:hypothetical protein
MKDFPKVGDIIRLKPRTRGDGAVKEHVFTVRFEVATVTMKPDGHAVVVCRNTDPDTAPDLMAVVMERVWTSPQRFTLDCVELVAEPQTSEGGS